MANEATPSAESDSGQQPVRLPFRAVFFLGGVPLCCLTLLESDQLRPVSIEAIAAGLFVMVLPLLYGYWAFFRIIEMVPTSVASLSIVAVPAVSLLLGPLLVDEPITTTDLFAFALITGALLTVLPLPRFRRPGLTGHTL